MITNIVFILVTHWLADFLFQDVNWATEKHNDATALFKHTATYSTVFFFATHLWTGNVIFSMYFALLTFIIHSMTDWITSMVVNMKFSKEEFGTPIPNTGGFTIIGLDQLLHYIQLFVTWRMLL